MAERQPLPDTREAGTPTLADKVDFLSRPDVYPDRPRAVSRIETHMSWVFLTDQFVYKLKKPVLTDHLDLRTLAARRANCETELSVNRRFAPAVYLGPAVLTLEPHGLALDGGGPAADWLVKMRRLPAERLLDHALRAGTATAPDVRRVAVMLSHFYRGAAPEAMTATEYLARLDRRLADDALALTGAPSGWSSELAAPAIRRLREVIAQRPSYLTARADARRIVEGHGDLRPEHVCLGDPVLVIDSLEFDRELRLVDPIDELSYLAMECERLDAPWIGSEVLGVYQQVTGDTVAPEIVHVYAGAKACLRAKLSLWHLRDDDVADPQRWTRLAEEYLQLAATHAGRLG